MRAVSGLLCSLLPEHRVSSLSKSMETPQMLANSSHLKILAMASWNVLKAPKFYFNKTLTAKIGNTIEATKQSKIKNTETYKSLPAKVGAFWNDHDRCSLAQNFVGS